MVEKSKRVFSDYISEATLITVGTGLAYSVAFLYEAGYFSAFNLPLHLIQVQLDTVLIILITLSTVFWILFSFINFIALTWPKSWVIQEKIFRICLVLIFPIWRLLLYGWQSEDLFLYLFPLAILFLFEFVWPIVVFHKKKTLKEKFEADEIAESLPRSKTIFGRLRSLLGPIGYFSILLFLLLGKLSYDAGKAKAHTQIEYYLLGESVDTLVLRVYKTIIICTNLDDDLKTLKSSIVIKRIDGDVPIVLILKDIGPLNFENDEELVDKTECEDKDNDNSPTDSLTN